MTNRRTSHPVFPSSPDRTHESIRGKKRVHRNVNAFTSSHPGCVDIVMNAAIGGTPNCIQTGTW